MTLDKKLGVRQIGRNVIMVIKGVKYSKKTIDNEEVKKIQTKVEIFNKKPTASKLEEILDLFKDPEKEKLKSEVVGISKSIKKAVKEDKGGDKLKNKKLIEKVKKFYKDNKKKDDVSNLLVVNKNGDLAMKGCDIVSMPSLLVQRIDDFITKQTEIKSLLNFWSLCLLNPNDIARTKLFDYLQSNGLIITPSGYFVTYRMVKTTKQEGVYTDAHTYKSVYLPQTVCSIPRSECDEDGNKDCSKGLHTGTPLFIGIKTNKKKVEDEGKGALGDGYGVKYVTTKTKDSNSYGTGYDNPKEITQTFNNTFGNQAIITLINPMHVVSIPNSDTRKMRSCEFYFAKLTTPEEVIDMVEKDYLLYDIDYQNFELKQLQELLKNKTLKAYVNEKTEIGVKVAKLTKELEKKKEEIKLSGDIINSSLDLLSIKNLIKQRQIVLR